MLFDASSHLPTLLRRAVGWAKERAAEVQSAGAPLNPDGLAIARRVGVRSAQMIRVQMVSSIPLPDDPLLKEAAVATGMLGFDTVGLTLGHSLLICQGHYTPELLAHECRHVHQYELHGGIDGFLPLYLQQILEYGYFDAPFEVDARNHERFA